MRNSPGHLLRAVSYVTKPSAAQIGLCAPHRLEGAYGLGDVHKVVGDTLGI